MVLGLLRVRPGSYEIDGRQVMIYWESSGDSGRLLVREDEVGGPSMGDMPLNAYIKLVAAVALDLQKPVTPGMTFVTPAATSLKESDDEDRYRAMRVACTQAKLREERFREDMGSRSSPR